MILFYFLSGGFYRLLASAHKGKTMMEEKPGLSLTSGFPKSDADPGKVTFKIVTPPEYLPVSHQYIVLILPSIREKSD